MEVAAAEPTPAGAFGALDADALRYLLSHFLSGADVARLAACSTALRACASDACVWSALCAREHADVAPLLPCALGVRERYALGRSLALLPCCAWRSSSVAPECRARMPPAREGSACAALDDERLVVVGGWTTRGLGADVSVLRFAADGSFIVQQPALARRMPARYGHSLTATAAGLLVFGGHTGGGYTGELNDVWVLRPPEGGGSARADGDDSEMELEWHAPPVGPLRPRARGYHSAAASPCGRYLYVFGGISAHTSTDELAVLDTQTWAWTLPDAAAPGAPRPCGRFGHSATMFEGGMWVLGGGTGGDLLRDGRELRDVWRLDAQAMQWARVTPENAPPFPGNLSRCHTAVRVGAKLLLYGGGANTCARVSTLDLRTLRFAAPRIAARRAPGARFTHLAARLGGAMVLAFGWCHGDAHARGGCMGDVWRLQLAPDAEEAAAALEQAPAHERGGGMRPPVDEEDEEGEDEEYVEEGEDDDDDAEGGEWEEDDDEDGGGDVIIVPYFA